jgi:hypothetical protein
MIITLKNTAPNLAPILLNNTQISEIKEQVELGLTLTNNMSWQPHIDKIVKKASKRVAILSRIRHKLPRSVLERIYISMIRPVLEYGNIIYDNCTLHQSEKLESIQRKAALICSGAYRHTEHTTLLSELGWESLSIRRHIQKLTMYFKMTHNLVPNYLCSLTTNLKSNITSYRLRNRDDRVIPKTRTVMYHKSLIPSSTKLWNSLPAQHRNTPLLNSFKNELKKLFVPDKHKYHTMYKSKPGIWLARLRMGLSALNSHRFKYNFIASPSCDHCHSGNETTMHYFFLCPAYAASRLELLNNLDIKLGIDIYNKQEMLNIILHGDIVSEQIPILIEITTNYLLQTERFK